jgi:hypothetical protein
MLHNHKVKKCSVWGFTEKLKDVKEDYNIGTESHCTLVHVTHMVTVCLGK